MLFPVPSLQSLRGGMGVPFLAIRSWLIPTVSVKEVPKQTPRQVSEYLSDLSATENSVWADITRVVTLSRGALVWQSHCGGRRIPSQPVLAFHNYLPLKPHERNKICGVVWEPDFLLCRLASSISIQSSHMPLLLPSPTPLRGSSALDPNKDRTFCLQVPSSQGRQRAKSVSLPPLTPDLEF